MIRMTRRRWVMAANAALTSPGIIRRARAAEFSWRMGHTAPNSFPLHRRLMEAAAEVAEKSGGRMEITVSSAGQSGNPIGQLAQVRGGMMEMAPVAGQTLASAQAVAALPMTGFAWSGFAALWPAMDGDLGRVIRDLLQERLGLTALDTVWDFGFRVVTTAQKPIRTTADLTGLRLRTPVEPEIIALFKALNASPIAMTLSDAYRALSQRELDGQEGLLALVAAVGFDRTQSLCARTNHVWDGHYLCVNTTLWRRLPEALKAIVTDAFNAAGLRQRADHATADVNIQAALARAGMQFNSVDPASFRATLREAGYYRDLRRKFGPQNWDVLERFAGPLA